jgi:ribosomal protein S20
MAKLKTGRHTSALKENRKAKQRTLRNRSKMSRIKTLVKKVEDAVAKKDATLANDLLRVVLGMGQGGQRCRHSRQYRLKPEGPSGEAR